MGFIGKQPAKAAITSSDITDGVVTADKLASNAVTTAKINADAVTDAKIADDVVGTEHLTAGEVDTTALGADAVTSAKIADDAINSEHYTDGSIDTAHIADANVTQAKIADQAINEAKMQISNSPTNGYFLSAQSGNTGGLTWAEAGGGDMVKISTSSLSGASSWYTDSLDSTYFAYKIIARITDISTQYAKIYARLRASSSDLTGSNYTWSCGGWFRYTDNSSGNGELKDGYAGGTAWSPHGEGGLDTDDGEGINMEIDLFEPSSTSGFKKGLSYSTFLYDSARWYTVMGSFKYASQSAYTGFKLYTSAGTMTGTVNLYGIK